METSIPCNQVLFWPSSQWTKTTALQAATQKFFSTLQESMVSEQWNIGKHETRSSCLSAGSWFSFEMCQVWTFTLKIQLQKNPEVFQKMLQNFSVAWPKRLLEHGRGTTLFAIPPLSFVNKNRDFCSQPGCWRGCVAIYCTENVGSHGNEFENHIWFYQDPNAELNWHFWTVAVSGLQKFLFFFCFLLWLNYKKRV